MHLWIILFSLNYSHVCTLNMQVKKIAQMPINRQLFDIFKYIITKSKQHYIKIKLHNILLRFNTDYVEVSCNNNQRCMYLKHMALQQYNLKDKIYYF